MRVDPNSPVGQAIQQALADGAAVETGVNRLALEPPDPHASEKEFQAAVVKLAKRHGWLVFHCHDSRKSEAGLPDLLLVRERLVWAELKTATGRLTAAQQTWTEALRGAGCVVYHWRPENWPKITEVLR